MIEDLIKPKVLNYSIQDKPCNSESEIDWDAIIEKAVSLNTILIKTNSLCFY